MQGREQVACGSLPPTDQALSPLVSPSSSIFGKATCPSRNCRIMDGLLIKLHKAMATQTQLANTGAIMSLYLRHLSRQTQEGSEGSSLAGELLTASSSFLYYEGVGRSCRQGFGIPLGCKAPSLAVPVPAPAGGSGLPTQTAGRTLGYVWARCS